MEEGKSFAMEMLQYSKRQNEQLESANKRLIGIIVLLILSLLATVGYLIYILNDIGSTEETIDIQDVETIDNSHIKIGEDIWE